MVHPSSVLAEIVLVRGQDGMLDAVALEQGVRAQECIDGSRHASNDNELAQQA